MSVLHPLLPLHQLESRLKQAEHAQAFLQVCNAHNANVFLVGGAVRDLLYRQILSTDLDFVVPTHLAQTLAHEISEKLDGKCICLDERYQIYRVILFPDLNMLDIAGCIGKDIHEDLLRRDLTVNAIAYDFTAQQILDPCGGQQDLEAGVIRMVSEHNLLDDPLRLLRVFRIGAELGFCDVDSATLDVVRHHGEKLLRAAPERIHYELMKMLSLPRCFDYLRLMADTGLLEHVFPELSATHQVPPNLYHHLGLFDHTLELVNQAELHFSDLPQAVQERLLSQANPFTKQIALVRLACLFHDLGKPATMEYDAAQDRYKFYGHEEVSEELTHGIALRLKWGKDITRSVCHLVRWHLYPADMLRPEISLKGQRRFFRRMSDLLPEMLLLAIADRFSAKGPAVTSEDLEGTKAGLIKVWDLYQDFLAADEVKPKLLTGSEIMKHLQIESGPQVGRILHELSEAYLNGELSTREEAMTWLNAKYGAST